MSPIQDASNSAENEPELRYFLAGGKIGVPDFGSYARTAVGAALWMGPPLLLARLLSLAGARAALHGLTRWWARRVTRHLCVRLDLAGLEQINPAETYVVAPLHEGFADVLALLHLPLKLRFATRDELFGWRLLGPYLRDTGQINVSPERGSRGYRQLLRTAGAIFAAGESLVVFPQGTILGIETDFMIGAFALARALDRPLLPIALTGSHRVWEHPYTPRLRFGQRISLRVLPPVCAGRLRKERLECVRFEIQQQVKSIALSGTLAAPRRYVPARDGFWDGYAFRIDPQFKALAAEVARHKQG